MKVEEAVEHMSKQYLTWIFDSFTEDVPKPSVDEARKKIIQHTNDLSDAERISKRLEERFQNYPDRILQTFILESLLNSEEPQATEAAIFEDVQERERSIQREAKSEDCFEYTPDRAIDILKTVLEVSVEDREISRDELALVERLRDKLELNRKDQYLALAQLGHFPRAENKLHGSSDVEHALKALQKAGVLFYCNRHPDDPRYLLPDELVPGVREAIGFELSDVAKRRMFDDLTMAQLKRILDADGLPTSGRKGELVDRLLAANVVPSDALDVLTTGELYEVLSGLPGAKVTGNKDDRIQRIIDYWANQTIREVDPGADPREVYYEYLIELAHRDRENLYASELISKDIDMNSAFEEGTRFLFEEKLGLNLVDFDGTEHPDGAFYLDRDGQLLMWDNKSTEDVYRFPKSHLDQFKGYIRESEDRISCFLVVVAEIGDEAFTRAQQLKAESRDDTDTALITAEDLKWVAENWRDRGDSKEFDPQVFNYLGVLDRQTLKARMGMFL